MAKKKEITIVDVWKSVKALEELVDHLAILTSKGFEENQKQHNVLIEKAGDLEQGQEDIKLRLDNVAYRFELVELQNRVAFLEKKMGISHR